MSGWPAPNGHCDVCDQRYFYDEHEESSDCPLCERIEKALHLHGFAAREVKSWVQAVAKKAAADAVAEVLAVVRVGGEP